jgi:hypothetical protein
MAGPVIVQLWLDHLRNTWLVPGEASQAALSRILVCELQGSILKPHSLSLAHTESFYHQSRKHGYEKGGRVDCPEAASG